MALCLLFAVFQIINAATISVSINSGNGQNYGMSVNGGTEAADPAITCNFGDNILFTLTRDLPTHPFYFRTEPRNNGDIVAATFTPQGGSITENSATANLQCDARLCVLPNKRAYYQCQVHNEMFGTITVNGCPAGITAPPTPGVTTTPPVAATPTATGAVGVRVLRGTGVDYVLSVNGGAEANDPAIRCSLGQSVVFTLAQNLPTHPLYIRTASENKGDIYTPARFTPAQTAASNAGDVITVPCDSSLCAATNQQVFYQCQIHNGMWGTITIDGCPGVTICQKYANALNLNQTALMNTIVAAVVAGEVADDSIKPYFDGTKPAGSTNYLLATSPGPENFKKLSDFLVAFFGSALGCNDPTFPKYTGPTDMRALHQPMMIPESEFKTFNDIFINELAALGVDKGDQTTIRGVLDSFADDIIFKGKAPSGNGSLSKWDDYGRTVLVACVTGTILIIGIVMTLIECVK